MNIFKKFSGIVSIMSLCGCVFAACSDDVSCAKTARLIEKVNVNMENDKIAAEVMSADEIKKAKGIFERVLAKLISEYGKNELLFKSKIVFVNGAPGAGKATNRTHIMRMMEIPSLPIEVSSLLTSPEAEAIKAKGGLVDDEMVMGLVFAELIAKKDQVSAVIIDGFPRTKIQAYCLSLLIDVMQESEKNKHCVVSLVQFSITHETSIARQLHRGRSAIEHNSQLSGDKSSDKREVRATDLSVEGAEKRWQGYVTETTNTLALVEHKLDYYDINTEGTFDEVRDRIYDAFSDK